MARIFLLEEPHHLIPHLQNSNASECATQGVESVLGRILASRELELTSSELDPFNAPSIWDFDC